MLVPGPSLEDDEDYLSLLRAEDGAALLLRHGTTVERWDVSGPTAVLGPSATYGAYPRLVRPDQGGATYLVVLGYGGLATFPD